MYRVADVGIYGNDWDDVVRRDVTHEGRYKFMEIRCDLCNGDHLYNFYPIYDEEKQLKPSYNDPDLFSESPLADHLAGNCYLCRGLHYQKDCAFNNLMILLEEARDKSKMMEMRLKLGNGNLTEMDERKEDPWKRKGYIPQISLDPRYCTRLPEYSMEPIQYMHGLKIPPKSRGTQVEPQDWLGEIIEEPHQEFKVIMGGTTKLYGKAKQPNKAGGPESTKRGATPTGGTGSVRRPSSLRLTRGNGMGTSSSGGLRGARQGGGGGGNGPPSDGGDPGNSSEDSTSTSEDERLYRIYRNRHLFAAGAGGPGDPDPNIPWIFRGQGKRGHKGRSG